MCLSTLVAIASYAGDDASGPIHYAVDLSEPFTLYQMSSSDERWRQSLIKKLRYAGKVVHFVRTSNPLMVDNSTVDGAVYRAIEHPDYFHVVNGDAMLRLGTR